MANSLAPALLIAVPQLLDPNFHHSVILLIEHSSEGALGVIINRPSPLKMGDLLGKMGIAYAGDPDARVLFGGPVMPDSGMVIHAEGNESGDSKEITGSIYIGSSPNVPKRIFDKTRPRALFLLGHAGWSAGQLERELEGGAWIPSPVDDALVFNAEKGDVWHAALRALGIDPRLLVRGDSDAAN